MPLSYIPSFCLVEFTIRDFGLVRWEGCSYLQSTWEDATSLATAPKVVKAYKAKTKQRDMSLRAEAAWTCLTAAPPAIADSSWRVRRGRRYGQRT